MAMEEALRSVYETYIQASLTYDERRLTLLQYFLVGLAAIFAFWFNIDDRARRKALFLPLIIFTTIATYFSASLVYFYSRDSHVYFIYAEKMMREIFDIVVEQETMKRGTFVSKWLEANQQFTQSMGAQASVYLVWIAPMVCYAVAFSVAAFVAQRRQLQGDQHTGDG